MSHALADIDDAPVEPGSQDTRTRLLRAAAVVLSRRGYSQARLGEIAKEANLKAPAVYYHFAGRDALVTAALLEGQILVREHVLAALNGLPADAGSQQRILRAVDAHLRVELELSDFASAVVRTAGHVPAHIRAQIEGEIDAYYDVWRGLLGAAEADGLLHPHLDHSVARMFVLGALNWAVEWRTPATTVDHVVANAISLIDGALFVEPS